jgi:hypothetical protein
MNNENLTLHFKVKDFNAWQTSYNGNEKNRASAGITKSKVFRSTDDPNDVLLLQDVADVSKARTWYNSSEMKSVMEKSGVVGSPIIRVAAAFKWIVNGMARGVSRALLMMEAPARRPPDYGLGQPKPHCIMSRCLQS